MALKLHYHQRETRSSDLNVFNFGPYWNCNWLSYIDVNDPTTTFAATVYGSGGGERSYAYGQSVDFRSRTEIQRLMQGANVTGFRVEYPNGSYYAYELLIEVSASPEQVRAFLSQQVDPQGNVTTFLYATNGGLVRLTHVIDHDGRTNTLQYASGDPTKVTHIANDFGHAVSLAYETNGFLINVTDVAGIESAFTYQEVQGIYVLTKLTTPYGDTGFEYFRPSAGLFDYTEDDDINRAIVVTPPVGGNHLFMYRDNSASISRSGDSQPLLPYYYEDRPTSLPVGGPADQELLLDLCNYNMYYRNSFYWGPLQYSALSTQNLTTLTTNDYRLARVRNWLHAKDIYGWAASETLNFQREPTPDGIVDGQSTWYGYRGKLYSWHTEGSEPNPSYVARLFQNGEVEFKYREYNAVGQVTLGAETYSGPSSVAVRTNTFVYDNSGIDLLVHLGPSGSVEAGYSYNSLHQPIRITNALNEVTHFNYDADGRVTGIYTPGQLTTTNIYYGGSGANKGRLAQSIDLEIRRTNSYTWYASGNMQVHTDERGLSRTFYWDPLNRLTGMSFPDGTSTTNIYSRGSEKILDVTATKDRLNFWSYFGYDGLRRRTAATNANNVVTRFGYCDCGSVSSVTNAWGTPASMATTYQYDLQGRLTHIFYPDLTVTNWFDSIGRVIARGDHNGFRWFGYNHQGLLTSITNAFGIEMRAAFDIEDLPVWSMDANGVAITNSFDPLHRIQARAYPDGGIEQFGYSPRGLTSYTNQLNLVTRYVLDEVGRKLFETNANNEYLRFTNNAAGDLLSLTDGKNQTTRWRYDEYGRMTNKFDQIGFSILRYHYDVNNRLTNRWSIAKGDTKYSYDAVGNLTLVDYPSGTADVTFAYDWLNRVTNMVDAAGTTKYAYSAGGQLWTEDGPWANDTITNIYVNRLRRDFYLQQPTGLWTNRFSYDEAGRLGGVTSPAGAFGYQLGGTTAGSPLVRKLLYPNTTFVTNSYDVVARLTATSVKHSSGFNFNWHDYANNVANQRTQQSRVGSTVNYSYDSIGQLTVADSTVNAQDRGYSYDAAWNLSRRTNNGTPTLFSVNVRNELTGGPSAPYSYDGNGNMTQRGDWTQTFDAE